MGVFVLWLSSVTSVGVISMVYPIMFVCPHFDLASIVHAAPSTIRAPSSLRRHRSVKVRSPALPIEYTT